MKAIKILIFTAVLAAAAACDPTEMVTYEARNDEAFFETSSYSFVATSETTSCSVTVSRGNSEGAITVPVTVAFADEPAASLFSAPDHVEFADGEIYADYTISLAVTVLTIGVKNAITITLDSETDLLYSTECSVSIMRDYTWIDYATGTYSSAAFDSEWTQTLQQAQENTTLFRFENWYMNGDPDTEAGYNFQFTWDGSSATLGFTETADSYGCVTIPTGYSYGSYGMTYMYIDTATDYTYYDSATQTFNFNYQFIVSAGYLMDWTYDTFTLGSASSGGE